jgi:hypothetical protein
MSTTKLNHYSLNDSFIQVRYFPGYKYIDKAGEILNLFMRDLKKKGIEFEYNIGIEGLLIRWDDSSIEYKITSEDIWMHYKKPLNLGNVIDIFKNYYDDIITIIEPDSIRSVGWRNYLIDEKISPLQYDALFKQGQELANQKDTMRRIEGELEGLEVKINLTPLKNIKDGSKKAIMYDVDLIQKLDGGIDSFSTQTLRDMNQLYKDKLPSVLSGLGK